MAAELVGHCRCPLCASEKARMTLSKSQLPVLTCNACNMQLFCRSDRSDELARSLLVKEPEQAAKTEPAQAVELESVPTKPEPVSEPKKRSWLEEVLS